VVGTLSLRLVFFPNFLRPQKSCAGLKGRRVTRLRGFAPGAPASLPASCSFGQKPRKTPTRRQGCRRSQWVALRIRERWLKSETRNNRAHDSRRQHVRRIRADQGPSGFGFRVSDFIPTLSHASSLRLGLAILYGSLKISLRSSPTRCSGIRKSRDPGTHFSAATWPSQNRAFALCPWRKWPFGWLVSSLT